LSDEAVAWMDTTASMWRGCVASPAQRDVMAYCDSVMPSWCSLSAPTCVVDIDLSSCEGWNVPNSLVEFIGPCSCAKYFLRRSATSPLAYLTEMLAIKSNCEFATGVHWDNKSAWFTRLGHVVVSLASLVCSHTSVESSV
jgi:hypothetical protein